MTKRYYWLKLKNDFFRSKEIKKLRRIAGGDTYTIIYLKMLLLSLNDQGKLYFDGVEDTFVEELALEIDEDEDNVKVAVAFLLKVGLMEMVDEDTAFLTAIPEMIDSETDKAALMRRKRHREKQEKALQSNEVTNVGNVVTTSGNNVTEVLPDVTFCYTDIDIDKEQEKEKEVDDIEKNDAERVDSESSSSKIPYKRVQEMYNNICRSYSKCTKLSEARKKTIKARFNDGYTLEDFQRLFTIAESNDFLKGVDGGWKASFDWLIKDANIAKVLDGNYEPHAEKTSVVKPSARSQMAQYRSPEEMARSQAYYASIEE